MGSFPLELPTGLSSADGFGRRDMEGACSIGTWAPQGVEPASARHLREISCFPQSTQ